MIVPAQAANGRPDYDRIAALYHKHWCAHYHDGLTAMLERLLLARLSPGARILDVCCGAGTIARRLTDRGFRVTGIDASEKMLRFAFKEVPEAAFVAADVRQFALAPTFEAALCTFDSLSYVLEFHELVRVLSNIFAALRPGGLFLFDASLEEAYRTEWGQRCVIVEEDETCFVRGSYNEQDRRGNTLITQFRHEGVWTRTDVEFTVRCYSPAEILEAFSRAGFRESVCHRSDLDRDLIRELGPARACFVAVK